MVIWFTRRFDLPNGFDVLNKNMPAHQEVRPPNFWFDLSISGSPSQFLVRPLNGFDISTGSIYQIKICRLTRRFALPISGPTSQFLVRPLNLWFALSNPISARQIRFRFHDYIILFYIDNIFNQNEPARGDLVGSAGCETRRGSIVSPWIRSDSIIYDADARSTRQSNDDADARRSRFGRSRRGDARPDSREKCYDDLRRDRRYASARDVARDVQSMILLNDQSMR